MGADPLGSDSRPAAALADRRYEDDAEHRFAELRVSRGAPEPTADVVPLSGTRR